MFERQRCQKERGGNQKCEKYANAITLFSLNQSNWLKITSTVTKKLQGEKAENETVLVKKIKSYLWLVHYKKVHFLKREHNNSK